MTGGDPQASGPMPGLPGPDLVLGPPDLVNRSFVRDFHSNVSSDLILITEDKAPICLMRNFDRLRGRDAWKVPAGILATLLTVMVTAAPQDKFGLPKETWTALGWVSTALTSAWLVVDLVRLALGKHVDPSSIVQELKTITATTPEGQDRPPPSLGGGRPVGTSRVSP